MSLTAALFAGLLLGLANAGHCAGMCGAFALHAAAAARPSRGMLLYGLGKTATYAFLGALAGTLGAGLGGLGDSVRLLLGALVTGSLILAAASLLRDRPATASTLSARWLTPVVSRLRAMNLPGGRFTLGATTGLLPCGVTALAVFTAAAQGTALRGVLVMVAFGLGTLPALVAVATVGRSVAGKLRPRTVRVAAGLLLLAVAVLTGLRATSPWASADGTLDPTPMTASACPLCPR